MKSVKSTKVILLYSINKLGKAGSIITVKPGYAKNCLVAKRLALYATKNNMSDFEKNRADIDKKNLDQQTSANYLSESLKNKYFTFVCNASDDGKLYGSISLKNISEVINLEINKAGINNITISPAALDVGNGVKSLGVHVVRVLLYDHITTEVKVIACRSESEANSYKVSDEKAEEKSVNTNE